MILESKTDGDEKNQDILFLKKSLEYFKGKNLEEDSVEKIIYTRLVLIKEAIESGRLNSENRDYQGLFNGKIPVYSIPAKRYGNLEFYLDKNSASGYRSDKKIFRGLNRPFDLFKYVDISKLSFDTEL